MSFPTTPLLDNFQRANGGLGSNWNDYSGDPLSILSQQVYNSGGGISPRSGASWVPTSFGLNQEAWLHMATKASNVDQGVMLRWDQGAGNGYFVTYRGVSNIIYRISGNVFTQVGAAFNLTNFVSGDAYWGGQVEADGSAAVITAYFWKTGLGVWAASFVDPTPPAFNASSAKVGMFLDKNAASSRIDQFGGGNIVRSSQASGRGRVAEFDTTLVAAKAWF